MNDTLDGLLIQVEGAIDETPCLTRDRTSGFREEAEFVYGGGGGGWSVRCNVRNTNARGRGSRGFYKAQGDGATPELAVASLVERLPFFVQVTS